MCTECFENAYFRLYYVRLHGECHSPCNLSFSRHANQSVGPAPSRFTTVDTRHALSMQLVWRTASEPEAVASFLGKEIDAAKLLTLDRRAA